MHVLVTGGTGFLGAYVVRDLVTHGHEVTIYDLAPRMENLRLAWDGEAEGFEIVRGDIRDPLALTRLITERRVESVVHLAYMLSGASADDPVAAVQVNIAATTNLFDLVRTLGLHRIVWASSGAVLARSTSPDGEIDDEAVPVPVNVYGFCKAFNERMAGHYFRRFAVDSIGLRPTFLNGLGLPGGLTAEILRELEINPVLGRPGVVPCPNDVVSWLDIEETAHVFRIAVERPDPTPSRVFTLRGSVAPMNEMMETMRTLVPGARLEPGSGSNWGDGRPYISSKVGRTLEDELGYQPHRTPEEQLRAIVARIERHRDLVQQYFPAGA